MEIHTERRLEIGKGLMDSGKIINDELGILSFAQLCYARLGLVELSCVKSCFLICGGWKFLTAIRKI